MKSSHFQVGGLAVAIATALPIAVIAPWAKPPSTDPVASIIERLATGNLTLAYEPKRGYLDALLKELSIDASSQVLVFSKTSLQTDFITRKTPRAIYFNADTYVGWIPVAPLIEIASIDPRRGVIFYALHNTAKPVPALEVEPRDCVRCHGRRSNYRSPGLFANSVFTSQAGYPRPFAPAVRVGPDTPLRNRWGGWYVSGTHGSQRHMGNEIAVGTDESYHIDIDRGANLTSLRRFFDPSRYRSADSDIVALMTMEHQLDVQNVLTQAALTTTPDIDRIANVLLCSDDVRLTAPVQGTTDFIKKFAVGMPADHTGRSLGEFDLKTRLFKYPCSPLIYSKTFDQLPTVTRTQLLQRVLHILSKPDDREVSCPLSDASRAAILQILLDTKPEFAKLTVSSR